VQRVHARATNRQRKTDRKGIGPMLGSPVP
jgi:hypothetical protein